MDIVGQFRVLDGDDRFVWVRRYLEPASRAALLEEFYTGPVWKEFGPLANELMVEFDDVHLLAPDPSATGFAAAHVPHAERHGAVVEARSTVVAAFYELENASALSPEVLGAMVSATERMPGISELGRLVTATVPNEFPRLPVHEDVNVALWLLSDDEQGEAAISAAEEVSSTQGLAVRTLRLAPTPRSTLR